MRKRLGFIAVLFAILSLGVAACGGSDDSSSDSGSDNGSSTASGDFPAEFTTIVEDATKPPKEWPGPTESPAFKKDQFVFSIPCSKVAEGCERINQGVKSAAEAVGWKYGTVDPAGDPNKQGAAVEQAINQGANVIVLISIEPNLVSVPVKKARDQGITVICAGCGHENDEEYFTPTGIQADVSLGGIKQGEIMAAFLATDSDGEAKVAMMSDKEFPLVEERAVSTKENLDKCGGCEVVAETEFTQTEIGTTLGQKSQAFFQSNPEAEYGYVGFDAAAGSVVAQAQQSGASPIKIVSFDANIANIEFIEQGSQYASVGTALEWVGWAAVDNANRVMNGEERVGDDGVPSRLVTEENAADYAGEGFLGDMDYEAKYQELWDTGKTSTSVETGN